MKDIFETFDLWLAIFIKACGLNPTLNIKNDTVTFCFPASPDLDRLIINFQNNCNVPVLDFIASAKTLRGQMLALKKQRSSGGA